MKQKPMHSLSKLFSTISSAILFGCLALLLSDCFLKQDRTTTIYGTITDQNGQPVDSILVLFDGIRGLRYDILKEVYSDQSGNYELIVEVLKKYSSVSAALPYSTYDNPKYMREFKSYYSLENGIKTGTCCPASIGKKTQYDFQLIPK
jgi:hypothetical protein